MARIVEERHPGEYRLLWTLGNLTAIPSEVAAVEAARQAIRERYATTQLQIEAATTVDEIKAAMPQVKGST